MPPMMPIIKTTNSLQSMLEKSWPQCPALEPKIWHEFSHI